MTYYTYHLVLVAEGYNGHIQVPGMISVDSGVYRRFNENQNIVLDVREGYLHHPWLRKINPK